MQPCTHSFKYSNTGTDALLRGHKHKNRHTDSTLAHKHVQNKERANKNKRKGTTLHFVPGYFSVGSTGFPELQLQICCSPFDSSTLDFHFQWTK